MDLEKLSNFIIPIVMLVLYLILNAQVKKKEKESRQEQSRDRSSRKEPNSPRRAPLHVSRKIPPSRISTVSSGIEKKNLKPSYASKLVKGRSLREAFLMKEILNRPYE